MRRRVSMWAIVIMWTVGVMAILFAWAFANMAGLSNGFIDQRNTAFTVGFCSLAAGIVLLLVMRRIDPLAWSRWQIIRAIIVASGLAWLGSVAVVFAMQESLVFSPRSLSPERRQRVVQDYPNSEEITLPIDDDVTLHGWLVPGNGPRPQPVIIVFAGQGGEASRYLGLSEQIPWAAWAFINYRGYGLSTGNPSDANLFADAVHIYDALVQRPDVDGDNVFTMGGSLGTGVATQLAAQRPVAGVILFSPYDRLGGGVAQDMFPFLPTDLVINNRFDALAYAPNVTAPAIVIVGDKDTVIRPRRSLRLVESWGGPTQLLTVPGGDHYSIYEDEASWLAIHDFVRRTME